jgi:signal transduction histidine kinase
MGILVGILFGLLGILVLVCWMPDLPSYSQGLWQTLMAILALGSVIGIGVMIRRRDQNRLAELTAVAAAISQGNDQLRAKVTRDDAIDSLASSINALADRFESAAQALEARQKEFEDHREHLAQINQKMLEADGLRRAFVTNLSHEMRAPLSAIIGFSDLLIKNRDNSLSVKALHYAEKVNWAGKHLLGLVNDVLDVSRIEAGKMELELQCVQVAEVAREVIEILRAEAEARHLTLELQVEGHVPAVQTDVVKLKQILINLIDNAIKFTRKGGVTVSIRPAESDRLEVAVVDTGIGIAGKNLDAIFEPFCQGKETTAFPASGTGLGLTISRSLVELLGGQIWVSSQPGEGSVFTVQLPIKTERLVNSAAVVGTTAGNNGGAV